MKLSASFLLLVCIQRTWAINITVFLEQPGPGPVMAPIGTHVQLNCSVVAGYRIVWNIRPPGRTALISTDQSSILADLAGKGITVENPTNTTSLLVINATETNNNTGAICVAVDREDPSSREGSREVQVIFDVREINNISLITTLGSTDVTPKTNNITAAVSVSIVVTCMLVIAVVIAILLLLLWKRKKTAMISDEHDQQMTAHLRLLSEFSNPLAITKPSALSLDLPCNSVVVSRLKDDSNVSVTDQMHYSSQLLCLNNVNVIRFYTVCKYETQEVIVQEYVKNGDLQSYLRNGAFKRDNMALLVGVCMDIINGIKYIHTKLAPNNSVHAIGKISSQCCQVDEKCNVKIADFSMWMILCNNEGKFLEYARKKDLIRWWATECFKEDSVATVQTDLWAFGVTMWEIFTLCKNIPYHKVSIEKLTQNAGKGPNRMLLHKPSNCPDEVYKLMKSCWAHDPSNRPDVNRLHEKLSSLCISLKSRRPSVNTSLEDDV